MFSNELFETLATGIYHRFCKECSELEKGTKIENPIDFEYFVARFMESTLGGKAIVTKCSGDFGVDIEHTLDNKDIYLAQVKCYKPRENLIKYEPISILHSNIIKRNAKGGYFVTTSDYNNNAKLYSEGLGIELINDFILLSIGLAKKKVGLCRLRKKLS